jgi:DNA repair exonuclease SbcCD ATPase subunit
MMRHLGVSRAILSYVIFCHQEDSLWPLTLDSAKLKQAFDDIFAASRSVASVGIVPELRPADTAETCVARRYSAALDQVKEVQKQCVDKQKEADLRLETARAASEEARTVCGRASPALVGYTLLTCPGGLGPQRREQLVELRRRIQTAEGDLGTIQDQVARAQQAVQSLDHEINAVQRVRRPPPATRHMHAAPHALGVHHSWSKSGGNSLTSGSKSTTRRPSCKRGSATKCTKVWARVCDVLALPMLSLKSIP